MTIADQIKAATEYELWKLARIQDGGDFSVEAYERHLLAQGFGDRLDRIHEIAEPLLGPDGATPAHPLAAALAEIARLSDTTKEVA